MGFLPPNQNTLLQKIQYVESTKYHLPNISSACLLPAVSKSAALLAVLMHHVERTYADVRARCV